MSANKNAPATSSAVRAAAKDVAADGADANRIDEASGGFKALIWGLVVLNLAAAGGWAWMRFSWNGALEKSIEQNKTHVVQLKTSLENLSETVRRIRRDAVQQVSDPGTLMLTIAKPYELSDMLRTEKPVTTRIGKTNYEEVSVGFKFLLRSGFDFKGMLEYLAHVEKANPTVQIKQIDFGQRQLHGESKNMWEVKTGVVRVVRPRSGS